LRHRTRTARIAKIMALPERIRVEDFPHSPYARELARGVSRLRFSKRLERVYLGVHLSRMRVRVRLWFTLVAAMSLGDAILLLTGRPSAYPPPAWPKELADIASLILAALVWSRWYTRIYPRLAPVLMPVLAFAVAEGVAHGYAAGQGELLAVLPLTILALFFFTGLLYRAAVISGVVLFLTFLGTLLLDDPAHAPLPGLIMVLMALGLCIIGYRDVEYFHRRNFLETALISEIVSRDGLSGLMNRAAFDEHLQALWHRAQLEQRPLAVLMVDIDHFKAYNDSRGHQAGDVVLRAVARLLNAIARRPLDMVGRYGGDEFIAVLYDLPQESVSELAERLRQSVHEQVASLLPAGAAPITISVGVGVMVPGADRSVQGSVQLADEALYEAKIAGRNRVIVKGMEDYKRLDTGSFRASSIVPA
jgi:diguanylate cyclase (GGDEF)-like protein